MIWETGKYLLGEFIIDSELGAGGMGEVYKVISSRTQRAYAVKRAKGLTQESKSRLLKEIDSWKSIPENPNLNSYKFFRTLDNEVLLFSEFQNGGNLKEGIDSKWLYQGGEKTILLNILDFSIQIAWGIKLLHDFGIVHRDVKPSNVLLSYNEKDNSEGYSVKITDYGISSFVTTGSSSVVDSVSDHCTMAYCSPEQVNRGVIDHRSDIWSWGVTVLEMFTGGATWQSGIVAQEILNQIETLQDESQIDLPKIPDQLFRLLSRCFIKDISKRQNDMGVIIAEMTSLYKSVSGAEYPRKLYKSEKRPQLKVNAKDCIKKIRYASFFYHPTKDHAGRLLKKYKLQVASNNINEISLIYDTISLYEEIVEREKNSKKKWFSQSNQEWAFINLGSLYLSLAEIHRQEGDKDGAIIYYDKSNALFDSLYSGDKTWKNKADVILLSGFGASLILGIKAHQDFHFSIIASCIACIAIWIISIAGAAYSTGNNRSKKIASLGRGFLQKGKLLYSLGHFEEAKANYLKAENSYNSAIRASSSKIISESLIQCLVRVGDIYIKTKSYKSALLSYDKAISLWDKNKRLFIRNSKTLRESLVSKKAFALILLGNNDYYQDSTKQGATLLEESIKSLEGRIRGDNSNLNLKSTLGTMLLFRADVVFKMNIEEGLKRKIIFGTYDRAVELFKYIHKKRKSDVSLMKLTLCQSDRLLALFALNPNNVNRSEFQLCISHLEDIYDKTSSHEVFSSILRLREIIK